MRSLERGKRFESLANNIARVAYAYGFTSAPIVIPKKSLAAGEQDMDVKTAAAVALLSASVPGKSPSQTWGLARHAGGSVITFSIAAGSQAIAPAIAVKTALSIAELSGYTDLSVSISSVGDAESKKRFTRELGNFFKKNSEALPPEMKHTALANPDTAYRALLKAKDPLVERAPRSIDYLSESSRKTMLATLSLFESVGIPYTMNPRLAGEPGIHSEIVFAVEGSRKDGSRVRIASGGRYDAALKRLEGKSENAMAIGIEVPERIDYEAQEEDPACFVVHVGDAAKLRAFSLLEALWRAHVAVGQSLMAENLRDQMQRGTSSKAKYLAIIGQREALDNTVIVRSVATQMQTTLSLDKLGAYVTRGNR